MNGYQKIKRQLLPLLKGSPFILLMFLASLYVARKIILYSTPMYMTSAKIKLDDTKYGFSGNTLYSDFDVFSTENRIEAEVEVLKSPVVVGKALDSLDFEVSIYRVGKIKNALLYENSPVHIEYELEDDTYYDKRINLVVQSPTEYRLSFGEDETGPYLNGIFGEPLEHDGMKLTITHNKFALDLLRVDLEGRYYFQINSKQAMVDQVLSRLTVKAVDKDIAIIKVVYEDEVPLRAKRFTNMLCDIYINDYIISKTSAANKMTGFIDEKIDEVESRLSQAENDLERYKRANGVVNTRQETETGLREYSKLKIQLINLEMNEQAINELEEYLQNGDYFNQTAINFGFGDLLMTELVKKLKLWQDERHDLLVLYTADHDKVRAADAKIEEVKTYILEAIEQNKVEIRIKRAEIEEAVEIASHQFDDIPTREKEMQILDREFRLQEDVYNFLSQKRIEASIASSALISFHRVLEYAKLPKLPVSPNKVLITFVLGLFGLIVGIAAVYLRKMAAAKISSKEDVEKGCSQPVAGIIRKTKGDPTPEFKTLLKGLLLRELITEHNIITVASTLRNEGKSFCAHHLANTLAMLGYRVAAVDTNVDSPSLNSLLLQREHPISGGSAEVLTLGKNAPSFPSLHHPTAVAWFNQLKEEYDFVIVDTPASIVSIDALEVMKHAQLNLYLVRVNHTGTNYLEHIDLLIEDYGIERLQVVVNGAHRATDYTGNFIGSKFTYKRSHRGVIGLAMHYYNYYVKS